MTLFHCEKGQTTHIEVWRTLAFIEKCERPRAAAQHTLLLHVDRHAQRRRELHGSHHRITSMSQRHHIAKFRWLILLPMLAAAR